MMPDNAAYFMERAEAVLNECGSDLRIWVFERWFNKFKWEYLQAMKTLSERKFYVAKRDTNAKHHSTKRKKGSR